MARLSYLINVIAPVLLAVVICVAYQLGYVTYVKHPDDVGLTDALNTLEERLRTLETDLVNLGNNEEAELTMKELEQRLDGVQKILESVNQDKSGTDGIRSDRHEYVTQRDQAIFLMLGGLSVLQIGLVTSIYFLFRRFKKQSTVGTERVPDTSLLNDDTNDDVKKNVSNGECDKDAVNVNDT